MAPQAKLVGVTSGSVTIRPATAADQATISRLIRAAHLNPRDLDWRRFLVADAGDRAVGCAQARIHRHGTRELASVAVEAELRGAGIGSLLVEAILAREPGVLYVMTERRTEGYFARFGFRRIRAADAPPDFRRQYRIAWIVTTALSPLARRRLRVISMRREATDV